MKGVMEKGCELELSGLTCAGETAVVRTGRAGRQERSGHGEQQQGHLATSTPPWEVVAMSKHHLVHGKRAPLSSRTFLRRATVTPFDLRKGMEIGGSGAHFSFGKKSAGTFSKHLSLEAVCGQE